MVSGSNSYMRLRDENNANQATWEYTANEVRLYNNNAEDLWFGVNASKVLEIDGSSKEVSTSNNLRVNGDLFINSHIRPTDGILTVFNNDSGSWGRVNCMGTQSRRLV